MSIKGVIFEHLELIDGNNIDVNYLPNNIKISISSFRRMVAVLEHTENSEEYDIIMEELHNVSSQISFALKNELDAEMRAEISISQKRIDIIKEIFEKGVTEITLGKLKELNFPFIKTDTSAKIEIIKNYQLQYVLTKPMMYNYLKIKKA